MTWLFKSSLALLSVLSLSRGQEWRNLKATHLPRQLPTESLIQTARSTDMEQFERYLTPILVPRVVGTPNHAAVRRFIVDEMNALGWSVETTPFRDRTPLGNKDFENIIATLDPKANRRLVLACHYDSKPSRSNKFVGATDSAVPCAMMMSLARDLARQLDAVGRGGDLTLQFVFFDGEEAFRTWTSRDSIYGARHLAKKWAETSAGSGATQLDRMDLLVLLDLLGAPKPTFYDYIPSGSRWFKHMMDVEKRLREQKLLVSNSGTFFSTRRAPGGIEDDHIPFMQRGVPVLHLIPAPFPDVWHTDADDRSALDAATINDLGRLLRVAVLEYLNGGQQA